MPARNHSDKCRRRIAEAIERDEKRHRDEDVEMEESEIKRSRTDEDANEPLARKRASDVDVRELEAQRKNVTRMLRQNRQERSVQKLLETIRSRAGND